MEAELLVAATGDVEAEDAAPPVLGGRGVVAGEQRDDCEALHGLAQVVPDHGGQPGRLPGEGHGDALDLLEVRQLDLVELHEVHREPDGTREGHRGEVVGGVHLLQVTLGDQVAHRRPPVARDQHAVAVGERQHGRAVRGALDADAVREDPAGAQQFGAVGRQELREGRGARSEELLPQPALVIARHHPASPLVRDRQPTPT